MSKRPFAQSWTTLDMYENCPRKFLWSKGWGKIDLGNGPGKRKIASKPRSWHNALMGVVIGDAIEDLYNLELWREPSTLRDRLVAKLESKFRRKLENPQNPIKWRESPDQGEMLDICRSGVIGYLSTMREQKFLGSWAKSEYKMQGYINDKNPVQGKCDIIFRRKDTGLTILDGKNGVKKIDLDKVHPLDYTKPDQLIFYAMLHYLKTGEFADRLGFVYYRHPYNESTGETGVVWVPYEQDDVKALAHRAVVARSKMQAEQFDPNPRPKVCQYCDYESDCPERQKQRKENSAKRKKKTKVTLDVIQDDLGLDVF